MATHFYTEMQQQAPANTQIIATHSTRGGYVLKTWLDLAGRGIEKTGAAQLGPNVGRPTYYVTKAAFSKIEKQYKVSFELLLD